MVLPLSRQWSADDSVLANARTSATLLTRAQAEFSGHFRRLPRASTVRAVIEPSAGNLPNVVGFYQKAKRLRLVLLRHRASIGARPQSAENQLYAAEADSG